MQSGITKEISEKELLEAGEDSLQHVIDYLYMIAVVNKIRNVRVYNEAMNARKFLMQGHVHLRTLRGFYK